MTNVNNSRVLSSFDNYWRKKKIDEFQKKLISESMAVERPDFVSPKNPDIR
jgi:hypothetical protein